MGLSWGEDSCAETITDRFDLEEHNEIDIVVVR